MTTEFGTPKSWGSVQYGWLYDAPTEGQELWEGEMTEKGAQAYLWHGNLLQHIEFDGDCWQAGGWYSYVVLPRFASRAAVD
jgi:hypothetical protein